MPTITLPYKASPAWMEKRILAGDPVLSRNHALTIDTDDLASKLAERAGSLRERFTAYHSADDDRWTITVFDSGLDPDLLIGADADSAEPMTVRVTELIGELPQLPEPTDDAERVIAAWEDWISEYERRALDVTAELLADPPDYAFWNGVGEAVNWGHPPLRLDQRHIIGVRPEMGPEVVQRARAAALREDHMNGPFVGRSYSAAVEATQVDPEEADTLAALTPDELSEVILDRARRRHHIWRVHDEALAVADPGFEIEMERWAKAYGSARLKMGLEDGFRMNAQYLTERLAREAPGFYAMPKNEASKGWSRRAGSPSEKGLVLRRRVQAALERHAPLAEGEAVAADLCILMHPPVQMFELHEGGPEGTDGYPSQSAWPWRADWDDFGDDFEIVNDGPPRFEAVVVENWLGRYYLVGAVKERDGIWATPNVDHFHEDGNVDAQDPERKMPKPARRKPPPQDDDDIPF